MRTKILHHNTANEYILNHALSLSGRNVEEDEQRCQDKKKNALLLAKKILALLPPKQRGCYLRYYVDGKSVAEIAGEDNISVEAVYKNIERAGKKISKFTSLAQLDSEQAALECLTQKQRSCYLRYYVDGKPVAEIAKEDNTDITTIYKHIKKAKKRMMELGCIAPLNHKRPVRTHLTAKQRSRCSRFYVDGKLVTEIANKDNISISCAYDCIKRAGAEFTKTIILAKLSPEQQSIIEKFGQVLNDCSLITHLIVVDYYINAMTAEEIADKINASRKRKWKVSAIREKIRDIGGLFSRNGIPETDLKALRKFLKDKSKEQADI